MQWDGTGDNSTRRKILETNFNKTELWAWARSGESEPFILLENGRAVQRLIRIVRTDRGVDYIYAQAVGDGPDDFSAPYLPFGLWGWNERLAVTIPAYAHLGNVDLLAAEKRLREAVGDEAVDCDPVALFKDADAYIAAQTQSAEKAVGQADFEATRDTIADTLAAAQPASAEPGNPDAAAILAAIKGSRAKTYRISLAGEDTPGKFRTQIFGRIWNSSAALKNPTSSV